jgi:hypothetical protein
MLYPWTNNHVKNDKSYHSYRRQVRRHGTFFPYFRLLEEGIEVDIAAPKKGTLKENIVTDLK